MVMDLDWAGCAGRCDDVPRRTGGGMAADADDVLMLRTALGDGADRMARPPATDGDAGGGGGIIGELIVLNCLYTCCCTLSPKEQR